MDDSEIETEAPVVVWESHGLPHDPPPPEVPEGVDADRYHALID